MILPCSLGGLLCTHIRQFRNVPFPSSRIDFAATYCQTVFRFVLELPQAVLRAYLLLAPTLETMWAAGGRTRGCRVQARALPGYTTALARQLVTFNPVGVKQRSVSE